MINSGVPKNWRKLQDEVAQILKECGLEVEVERDINTVRGIVNIDVYATDKGQRPPLVYLCECKHWRSKVPKTVVHSLRAVVNDYGANWGIVISSGGFQSGAYEAAGQSNVHLLDWNEFQELFLERWLERHFVPKIREEADPLVEYTEPRNTRIFRKADALIPEKRERFIALREQYRDLAFLGMLFYAPLGNVKDRFPSLPLEPASVEQLKKEGFNLPQDIIGAVAYRELLNALTRHIRRGVNEFDEVFGERA